MESLRWILLGAGLVFVLVIYMLGRSRKQRSRSIVDELGDDLPEFSANSLDNVDEGVGKVRVISRGEDDDDFRTLVGDDADLGQQTAAAGADQPADKEAGSSSGAGREPAGSADLVVLYILPANKAAEDDNRLYGSQINSAAQAMGLKFGDMNIYHYLRGDRSVFSMANMLEPGFFDPDSMHELKTKGLTIFMQLHEANPMDDLTEMLQRSYQLAGLLEARLCNHKRQPLTEQDAEDYRQKVRAFIESKNFELTMES